MSAYFRRIIQQQAQELSSETCYSNLENRTIVLMSKYIEQQQYFHGFHLTVAAKYSRYPTL